MRSRLTFFGPRVAGIVRDCSDAEPAEGEKKEDWRPRMERYLAGLAHHSPDSLLVSNADKLHNARAILFRLPPPPWGAVVAVHRRPR